MGGLRVVKFVAWLGLRALVCLAASGCASAPDRLWIGDAGDVKSCTAYGWGIAGAIAAHDMNQRCATDLRRLGYVPMPRVRLGIIFATDHPLTVDRFVVKSPAEAAGVAPRDRIVAVDGVEVRGRADLARVLTPKRPGDVVLLTLARAGGTLMLPVALGAEGEDSK
jgi:hypothetical protein